MSDNKYIGRRQSIRYINEDDDNYLLTFNSLERGELDEDCYKTGSFLYNSEEDIYKLNSLKKSRFTERMNSNNLEKIDEMPENSYQITKEDDDNKNLISQNFNLEDKLCVLYIVMISYLIFCFIELFLGYYSNSQVLMADSAHYFTEFIYFITYILIIYDSRKKEINDFYKGEIISTMTRAAFLLGFTFWLSYYIIKRFIFNIPSNGLTIIIMGIISLLFSIIIEFVLLLSGINNNINFSKKENNSNHQKDKIKNLFNNIITSCIIMIEGVLIYFLPLYLKIDPSCTLLMILILIYKIYNQISIAIKIIMKESPIEIDVRSLKKELKKIEGVKKVYDLEILNLNGKIYMSCHLITSQPQASLELARALIKTKYEITNSTIEVESYNDKKD